MKRWKHRPEGSTWGDWGDDDQLGRLIDIARAVRRDGGRLVGGKARLRRSGQRQHGSRPRGVVVGTRVDLAGFVLPGKRTAALAAAEVVVVRANDDGFNGCILV